VKMDYVIHIIGDEIIVELYQMFGTWTFMHSYVESLMWRWVMLSIKYSWGISVWRYELSYSYKSVPHAYSNV
jgi:hypothetical protein